MLLSVQKQEHVLLTKSGRLPSTSRLLHRQVFRFALSNFSARLASRRTIFTSLSLLTPSVHISLTYNNSLTDFVVLEEYRFQSLKPFDIAFSRTQLSHNRFIVNSTITNRLATDMMLTNVAFSVASSRVRQVYTSFDS